MTGRKAERVHQNKQPSQALNPLTPAQLRLLRLILDTIFRAEEPSSNSSSEIPLVPEYGQLARRSFSSLPDLSLQDVHHDFSRALRPSAFAQFRLGLNFLLSRPATFALTGYFCAFTEIPVDEREKILGQWARSSLALKRSLYSAFVTFPIYLIYSRSKLVQNSLGFPADGDPRLISDPGRRKPSYDFKFVENPSSSDLDSSLIEVLQTDVIVVGSGAGGSVVASLVAKAGYQTLVIEKGRFVPTENITGSTLGFDHMIEGNGHLTTADGKLLVVAGSTFGGGTTVNWSASLPTPFHIRRAWADEHGLKYFTTNSFADDLQVVGSRLGVSSEAIVHSKANQLLLDGGRRIGVHVDVLPQNTAGNAHDCGMCSRGCPFGEKQGATQTWLVDCAEAGCQFMQSARVERILFSKMPNPTQIHADIQRSTPDSRRKYAVGVLVRDSDTGKRFIVRARRAVVCSGGAINTPALLLRSGVRLNGAVGQGLHLHPATTVTGWFQTQIKPWEGSIMTAISCEAENRKGTHYGSKIEVFASSPGLQAGFLVPWKSSKTHKQAMGRYGHSFSLVVFARDRGCGKVTIDKVTGEPVIEYVLDSFDGDSLTEGMLVGCRILAAAGATKISTTQPTVEAFQADSEREPANQKFENWLGKVKKAGIKQGLGSLGSAHQMSSCRMRKKPGNNSVVSEKGKVWGFEKLWIADGSTLPTSVGVNPAVTIMGVSHFIGRELVDELRQDDQNQAENLSKR